MRTRTLSLGLAAALTAAGCSSSEDTSLAIVNVGLPNAECVIEAEPSVLRSSGQFDPQVGETFAFTPVVQNALIPSETTAQTFFTDGGVFVDANTISILGMDVCYLRGDDPRVSDFGSFADGNPIDCEADGLPGSFVAERRLVTPSSQVALFTRVLDSVFIEAAFGDDWDENNEVFTDGQSRDIFVVARVVGQRSNGQAVTSDYFPYPVTILPGGVDALCGAAGPDLVASCFASSFFNVVCNAGT